MEHSATCSCSITDHTPFKVTCAPVPNEFPQVQLIAYPVYRKSNRKYSIPEQSNFSSSDVSGTVHPEHCHLKPPATLWKRQFSPREILHHYLYPTTIANNLIIPDPGVKRKIGLRTCHLETNVTCLSLRNIDKGVN